VKTPDRAPWRLSTKAPLGCTTGNRQKTADAGSRNRVQMVGKRTIERCCHLAQQWCLAP
jgi:hypothetical protein